MFLYITGKCVISRPYAFVSLKNPVNKYELKTAHDRNLNFSCVAMVPIWIPYHWLLMFSAVAGCAFRIYLDENWQFNYSWPDQI